MPRGEPTVQKWLNVDQAKLVGKKPGKARLTVSELELVESGRIPGRPGMPGPQTVASIEVSPVLPLPTGRQALTPSASSGQSLRDRLDAYRVEYVEAVRRQDWTTCDRVNQEREPLFYELWEYEKGLPTEKRYWFPARVINQGHVFQPELTRKA